MKHKKILIVVAVVVVILVMAAIGNHWDSTKPRPSDPPASPVTEPAPTPEPTPSADPAPVTPEPTPDVNPLMEAEFKTDDVLSGSGDKIGKYGYIEMKKSDMAAVTGDQLVEFCENKVDGSGLNWVWIMFGDGTGIHIAPSVWIIQMEYGTTYADTRTFSALGSIGRTQENGEMLNEFTYMSYEERDEIKAVVDTLVPNDYKGFAYSCDVLTEMDGTYSVLLSIMVDVVPPESTEIISELETAINRLGYDHLSEIQIMAYKETQNKLDLVDSNMDLDPSLYKIPAE